MPGAADDIVRASSLTRFLDPVLGKKGCWIERGSPDTERIA